MTAPHAGQTACAANILAGEHGSHHRVADTVPAAAGGVGAGLADLQILGRVRSKGVAGRALLAVGGDASRGAKLRQQGEEPAPQ